MARPTADLLAEAAAHFNAGRLHDAERVARIVLDAEPNHADALHVLGLVGHFAGRSAEAAGLLERCVVSSPGLFAAWNSLGETRRALGQTDSAEWAYRRSIELSPDFWPAHSNLALLLLGAGRLDDAERESVEAIRLNANAAPAWSSLGSVYLARHDDGRARDCFQNAVTLQPDQMMARVNLGVASERLGDFDAAASHYLNVTRVHPQSAVAWNNLGNVRHKQRRFIEADELIGHALTLEPEFAPARWNRSLLYLSIGDHARGWRDFDARWQCEHWQADRDRYPADRRWDGSPLGGRTILLWCEQGFGDMIQFARFAKTVRSAGGRIVLETFAPLVELFRESLGVEVVIARGDEPPAYDVHLPLMSVPTVMALTESALKSTPYMLGRPERVSAWRAELARSPGRKVGICWWCRPFPDTFRSTSLDDWRPLLALDGVTFVSLQVVAPENALAASAFARRTIDAGPRLTDFAETAALMAALDHVVSVDTAVPHLAGAVGVPTSLILQRSPDWRWGFERPDTTWYDSVRIFRQDAPGNWTSVFAAVADALRPG